MLYRTILQEQASDRVLFLALPSIRAEILDEPVGQLLLGKNLLQVVVFDPDRGDRAMGSLNEYRKTVERVLVPYTQIPYAHGDLRCDGVFDRDRDRYLLITHGWDAGKRVHFVLVHIEIVNGKVWIHKDNTEAGVAAELVQAGIPQSQIVLGFHSPQCDNTPSMPLPDIGVIACSIH
jgi:hypothetical protein